MRYVLRQWGSGPGVELSSERFNEITRACENVLELLSIEEEWAIVAGNFVDLEKHLLHVTVTHMVYGDRDWNDFQDIRVDFARSLQNLLSSCRSYLDHTPRRFRALSQNDEYLKNKFKEIRGIAYDRSFGYRFMEQLRNHAQHFGIPLHGAMFDTRRIERESGDLLRHVAGASIHTEKLRRDPDFKKSILEEALSMGDKLDVFSLTREYIEELNGVHIALRTLILDSGVIRRDIIENEIKSWERDGGDPLGLRVLKLDEDENVRDCWTIFLEPFNRLTSLQFRNGSLHNLRNCYVSSELIQRSP